jgi:hypothetical protein
VTSLKETWQIDRQQRYEELLHRQQQVRTTLAQFSQNRQMQADHLREELRAFQQQLQQETQTLIAAIAADRALMAQQLFQNLDDFHQTLSATVVMMRQQIRNRMQVIQAEAAAIRLDTHVLLQAHQQERLQTQLEVMQSLTEFVTAMRSEVEAYLIELEAVRHDRVIQLQQQLQQHHEQRKAEVKQLFDQLAAFRAELADYCADIRQQVWGMAESTSVPQPALSAVSRAISPAALPAVSPAALPAALPSASPGRTATKTASRTASKPASSSKAAPSSKPAAPSATASRRVMTATRTKLSAKPKLNHLEQSILNHLQRVQQTTLAEVESAFGVTRFAAVDALRSLIKKGCITQRDHVYSLQA